MFTRANRIRPEHPTGISQPEPQRRRLLWSRLLRRGAVAALLVVGAAALFGNLTQVASGNAVISAQLVSLRAPVDGVLRNAPARVGEAVAAQAEVAALENPRADDRPREIARQTLERLRADLGAGRAERATLRGLLDELTARAERHRLAVTARLELQAANAARQLAAKQTELEQDRRDYARKTALTGTVAAAEVERARATMQVAEEGVAAMAAALAAARATAAAAGQGVLDEPGTGTDVAYSTQRADEVRLRLAELEAGIARTESAAAEAEARLAVENRSLERARAAVLRAPSAGMIWRLAAASGERLAAGDLVAQMVDCGNAFLAAAVPQARLSEIDTAGVARFRLVGEAAERQGKVLGVVGDSAMPAGGALAAVPAAGSRPSALVLVEMPASAKRAGACLVGRTAQVVLPSTRSSLASLWRRVPGATLLAALAEGLLPSARAKAR